MKLLNCLCHATLATSAAFVLGLTFDFQALPLLGLAVTSALLLLAGTDYAPARRFAARHPLPRHIGPPPKSRYTLPYAA